MAPTQMPVTTTAPPTPATAAAESGTNSTATAEPGLFGALLQLAETAEAPLAMAPNPLLPVIDGGEASALPETPSSLDAALAAMIAASPAASPTVAPPMSVAEGVSAAAVPRDGVLVAGLPIAADALSSSTPDLAEVAGLWSAGAAGEADATALSRPGSVAMDALLAATSLQARSADGAAADRTVPASAEAARQLPSQVGTPAWADELGGRLQWMTERGQLTASMRLSPEHLGPLEIQIAVSDDQARVWFGAHHADTRAALENALPRLREMFAAQGLQLAESGVFQQAPRDSARRAPAIAAPLGGADDAVTPAVFDGAAARRGLVDTYA